LVVVGDAHPTILNLPHMKSEKECYRYNKSSRAFTDRATLIAMSNEKLTLRLRSVQAMNKWRVRARKMPLSLCIKVM